MGFYQARSHQVVPVETCLIQKPQARTQRPRAVRDVTSGPTASAAYDEGPGQGLVRHRVRPGTNGAGRVASCCVVVNGEKLPREPRRWRPCLRPAVPQAVGVVLGVNSKPDRGNVILGSRSTGPSGGTDCADGHPVRPDVQAVACRSFYQVNREQAEALYAKAVEFAGLTGTETVLDLYCGAGTITLVHGAARGAGHRRGDRAGGHRGRTRRTPARNGVENVEFFCGDAAAAAADLAARGLRPDVICVDPPRKGLAPEVVRAAGADGAGADRVCVLRPGHAGPGREAVCPGGL